ncbi:putative major facilitator superfamily transporter [Streptomyces lydicamycinicus]|uniref:Putative major facilitator superfamily transporter n=1 Tax=Streptomyces lydicamycinicus TaxID=1546107 RepID=A0A0P4R8E9_9ACTN|nr:putative major facilitator superfamily transporter [Streptomyces lydicamycinicus]
MAVPSRPTLGRPFWLLFGGEAASAFGTSASIVALPVVALQASGDVREAGLASTALSAGVLLARLPAGVFADRFDRRALLLGGNLLGAAILVTLALVQARDALSLPVLTLAALLLGMVGSTLSPAENVAIRSFVHPDLLARALSLTQARTAATLIAGPAAGGALLATQPVWVFALDAATYLVAAVCMAALPSRAGPVGVGRPTLKAACEGIRFLWRSPFLRYAAVNAAVLNLVFNGLLIVVIASADGGAQAALGIGAQTAAIGAGALGGSLIAAPAARRLPATRGIALSTGVIAVALVGFATVHDSWAAAFLLALASACGPVVTVLLATVQIRMTPAELQGRVHSGTGFLAQAISPLGPTLAAVSTQAFGLFPTVLGAALLVVLLALAGGAITARHLHASPPYTAGHTTADGAGADRADARGTDGAEPTATGRHQGRRSETDGQELQMRSRA